MDPTTVSGTKNSFSTPSTVFSTFVHQYLYALPLGLKERVPRSALAGPGRLGRAGGRARRRPTARRRCVAPRGPCRACAARQAGGMRACRCACHSRWPGARNRPLGTGKPAAARAGPSNCRGAVSSAPDPRYVSTRPLRACLPRGGLPSRSCRTSRSRRKCLSLLCVLRSPHGAVRRRHRPQPPPGHSDASPTCPEVQHSRLGVLACRICICPLDPAASLSAAVPCSSASARVAGAVVMNQDGTSWHLHRLSGPQGRSARQLRGRGVYVRAFRLLAFGTAMCFVSSVL